MSESQAQNTPTSNSGCGCGSNAAAKVVYAQHAPVSEQQAELIARIQRAAQRKNSVYKTKTRIFM